MADSPFPTSSAQDGDSEWISISDLMSGLMLVFLCIAILFMYKLSQQQELFVEQQREQQEQFVAQQSELSNNYEQIKNGLVNELERAFSDDLERWDAEIIRETITVRFRNPDALFGEGKSALKPEFEVTLQEFFPKLAFITFAPEFRDDILEVRIEGHTSLQWAENTPPEEAYIKNMRLSQERAFNVLDYALSLERTSARRDWIQKRLRANGLSSSSPIVGSDGVEDPERSRRVEFRIVTNAEEQMQELKERLEQMSEAFRPQQ